MTSQVSKENVNSGFAPVKQEFVLKNEQIDFDEKLLVKNEQNVKRSHDDENNKDSTDGDAPNKKQKGLNKHRRNVMVKNERNERRNKTRMCMRFCGENHCPFGDKCTFSHDIEKFIETEREPDIGEVCHLYTKFGKCKFGAICRYGSSHLVDGTKNKFDESITEESLDETTNNFSKDLVVSLRKREYDFTKANDKSALINSAKLTIAEGLKEPRSVPLKKKLDFKGKLYLAPLTTVGNLPFRRICKEFGADITCSEMAMAPNILQAQQSEIALLRRHKSEDFFGVQICGGNVEQLGRVAQLLSAECDIDFIDLNMGCPIDLVYKSGAGSGLMDRTSKLNKIIYSMTSNLNIPLTLKMRTGIHKGKNNAHELMSVVQEWGSDRIGAVTIHGRTREQRYTRLADWNYIGECADIIHSDDAERNIPIFGSGDVMSHEEYYDVVEKSRVDGVMFARGALIKPWLFTEVKERRTWDIRSSERLDILKKYVNYGLEHWGSDSQGVDRTRRFLLEWLSFLYRYIPVGVLERLPQRINERPPRYSGRDDLETLMASPSCNDWISISELLLGKVPDGFTFLPKHRANAF